MSREPRYAIDLISGKLTSSERSHKNGWAQLRKCQLENSLSVKVDVLHGESWDEYDVIFIYHGMEQDGETLNLFGGATGDNALPYERLITYQDKSLFSLDIPMPDYGALCLRRMKNCDQHWANTDWESISRVCKSIDPLLVPELTTKLCIGDSHSFSAWQAGYMVHRKDGRTLSGVLKKSIRKEILDCNPHAFSKSKITDINLPFEPYLTHLTVYYGNIDIRHHICREDDPIGRLKKLMAEYEKQLLELEIKNIEIVCPLPIEDESRKLPKTGWFKGTPFYGSRDERVFVMENMIDLIKKMALKNGWNIHTWPDEWYKMDGTEFMNEIMERPKSVHLAPKFHRWNYWKNLPNDYKFEEVKKPSPKVVPIRGLIEF